MLDRLESDCLRNLGDRHIRRLNKLKRMEDSNADNVLMQRLSRAQKHRTVDIVRMIVELHTDRCI